MQGDDENAGRREHRVCTYAPSGGFMKNEKFKIE